MSGETVVYQNEMNLVPLRKFTSTEIDIFFSLCNKLKEQDIKEVSISFEELRHLIKKALQVIPATHLWINPDCGLKTRSWEEVKSALANMVKVAKQFREELNQQS